MIDLFKKNPNRKKIFIYIFLSVIFIISILFITAEFKEKTDKAVAQIPQKQLEIKKLLNIREKYLKYKSHTILIDNYLKKEKKIEILSFLEELADKNDIANKITSMKPLTSSTKDSEIEVQIVFKGLSTKELKDYLYTIEVSNNFLWIKTMRVKRIELNKGSLEVSMNIVTLSSS